MKLYLAENLKRLRKERDVTQEDLAGVIGVSFQAVSKWERGEGYPDITILPSIAAFFGVTLDELVGMNELQNVKKRDQILTNASALSSEGKIDECVSVLKEGMYTFPNDYSIMAELACFLDGCGNSDKERRENRDESIKLSERILKFCTDTKIRNHTQANMCFALWRNGEKERAIEIAKTLPSFYGTSETTLPKFLTGEEKIEFCQQTIQKLHWGFWWIINRMIEESHYSDEEKIALLRKSIAFYEIIYENEDYAFSHIRIADAYEEIAALLLKSKRVEEGIENLEKCAEHCIAYDTLPERVKLSSLLVNTLEYNKQYTSRSTRSNSARNMLDNILRERDGIYQQCMEEERMKQMIEKLRAAAN